MRPEPQTQDGDKDVSNFDPLFTSEDPRQSDSSEEERRAKVHIHAHE